MVHHEPVHHVLIADDDRAIRESLARALELEGYAVTVVVDGVEALTHARRNGFDALVLDVMMPGVDGLGVCRVLRADGDHTPVLMLTARVETPDRVAGLDAGADDYLPKPFDLDELLARVRAGDDDLVILDVRARDAYQAGHIPGAAFFDIDAIADHSTDLPHMLPAPDAFAEAGARSRGAASVLRNLRC